MERREFLSHLVAVAAVPFLPWAKPDEYVPSADLRDDGEGEDEEESSGSYVSYPSSGG